MNKKQLIVIWLGILLLSGCRSIQDKSTDNDTSNVRVSGDVMVSAVVREGL